MQREDYKLKDTMIFEEHQESFINALIDRIFDDFEEIQKQKQNIKNLIKINKIQSSFVKYY